MGLTLGCTLQDGGDTDGTIIRMVLEVVTAVEPVEAGMGVEIGVDT